MSRLSKVVTYIQDNKALEMIYIFLRLILTFLQVFHMDDSNKAGDGQGYYHFKMTMIPILK